MKPGARGLAAGYFGYFGAAGIFQAYWPLHLAALGIPAAGIGALLALVGAVRVVAPLAAVWLADREADRRTVIIALGVAATGAAAVLAGVRAPLPMAAALVLYSLAFHGLMPVYDAFALERLGPLAHRYGLLRLWGSLGYVVTTALCGAGIARAGVAVVPRALVLVVAATALLFVALPRPVAVARATRAAGTGLRAALGRPQLRLFLAICFLQLTGFGGYYGFYTLYLRAYGHGPTAIGLLWAFGVLAEVAIFAFGAQLLARYRLERLLQAALAATALRWLLIAGFPMLPAVLLAAQALHLFGFGLFHTVSVQLAPRLLEAGSGPRAQALAASAGWGAGGIAGSLLAGAVWAAAGPRAVFVVSAGLAALAFLLARRLDPLPGP